MNTNKLLQTVRPGWSVIVVIALTTLVIIAISIYCLASGYLIIFQNLFYIPIIIACMYYTKRGFAFSVIIACLHFLLTIAFTRESSILLQAFVRVLIFVLVAGVITYLSMVRIQLEKELRQHSENLENLAEERTAEVIIANKTLQAEATERKQAEEALAESEKKLRALFETMSEGIVYMDHDGKIISANPAAERLLGLSFDQMQGRTSVDPRWKAIHADGSPFPGDTHSLNVAAKTGKPATGEVMGIYNPKSCAYIWLSVNSTPEFLPGEKIPFRAYAVFRDITERKRAEDLLRALSARQDATLASIPDILMEVDQNKVYTWANPVGLEFFGEGVIGKEAAFYFEGEQDTYDVVKPIFGGNKEVIYVESWQRRKDGEKRLLAWWCRVLLDADGNITGALSTGRDITERKRAEESLRESEERFRSLYENATIGIYRTTPEGQILMANPALVRMLGYKSLDDLSRRDLTKEGYEPEYPRHEFQQHIEQDGEVRGLESAWKRKDGAFICVRESARLVRDEKNQPLYYEGTVEDISERKQAEDLLKESTEQLHEAQKLAHLGVWDWKPDPDTVTWTEELYHIAGLDPLLPAPTYKEHPNLYTPESWELLKTGVEKALETGESYQFELELIRPNGESRHVNAFGGAKFDSKGQVNRLFGTVQDITERKHAEEKLKEYSEHLEEMMEERTRELHEAQEQLVRKEKLAVMGQLAGSVGHELRNPLGVINTAIYYLKTVQPEAGGKIKRYHAMIEQEVHNADKIITDLLDFARGVTAEPKPVSIPELVQRVIERFPVPASVEVKLEIPADLPMAFADPRQVEQVLGNLVTNAYQAMASASSATGVATPRTGCSTVVKISGKLEVISDQSAERTPSSPRTRSSEWVRIRVNDTGTGISPENMPKLFEPLFTTKAKGIGLGLAVSRKLAEANGGRIEVESEVGKGSTFTLVLPVVT